MRMFLMGAILTSLASSPAQSQYKGTESGVPFVGCNSDGQVGPKHAPKSRRTPVLPSNLARQLAFYAASDGPGVLAPRGWHCFGVYGSSGTGLLVAPEKLDSHDFFSGKQFSTEGNAVELTYEYGGTSGRWGVAKAIARYFPRRRDFIKNNFQGLEVGPLPSGPYPRDSLSQRTNKSVRYVTPPRTKGEGTAWMLAPSTQSVDGLLMLVNDPDEPDIFRVNVRLPDKYRGLTANILQNAKKQVR
jgi:hypothetical protein